MPALAPLRDKPPLFAGEVRVPFERGLDVAIGDEVRAPMKSLGEAGRDAVLHAEHLHGRVERFVGVGERDHLLRREELIGQLDQSRRATQQRLRLFAIGARHGMVRHGDECLGPREDRSTRADSLCPGERLEQRRLINRLGLGVVPGEVGERVGGEAVAGGAVTPRSDQVIRGRVVLGRARSQHDVLDLARMRASTDLFFELP